MAVATSRRLLDELNFEADLEYVYQFCYEAGFGDAGSENELCHVFLGRARDELQPNASEIAEVRYVSAAALANEFADRPERFTPWFKQEWEELNRNYAERLARYGAVA